ncbi:hypothetical protein A2881_02750 [Candidatus Peribacteria bacterium RIFCSPHIGHO2_01_FULL_55_13]|nr:MAG: hypothetical protein A2881_02750 [Candidatus Peribacteria bacterium RIFCSPHIGHO2_01_FULL_55_13]OGJ64274.1 MAG: hypothetical protein A3F36_02605 [Candidatus Peribacteria bacterium RIFCSPHIGHO2_12_FULL_55_11]
MELYLAHFEWDNECVLIEDVEGAIALGLPADLCEIYRCHTRTAIVTYIITISSQNIAKLKARLDTNQFAVEVAKVVYEIVRYANSHPTSNSFEEYCFVFVEP